MSAKAEIAWKTRQADGTSRQVYAHRIGGEWVFYQRQRRFERWQKIQYPSLEDWLCLLDGIQRRVQRRLLPPEIATRARRRITELFPNAPINH